MVRALLTALLVLACFAASSPVQVTALQFASYPEHTLVYLISDKEVQYRTGKLVKPERFYLDIANSVAGPDLRNRSIKVTDRFITSIRVAQSGPAQTRVVFDLHPGVAGKVVGLKNPPGLLVDLEKSSNEAVTETGPHRH